jgi:hypothetical protein
MSDVTNFIHLGLNAAGFTCHIGADIILDRALNLYFQAMPLDLIDAYRKSGIRYGFVCTERVTPDGQIGWGLEDLSEDYSAMMFEACRNASFVWVLLRESMEFCSGLNDNTHYCPFGYLEALKAPIQLDDESRDIDFLISGMLTERRLEVAEILRANGHTVAATDMFTPDNVRNSLLSRTRFHLALPKTKIHQFISPSRLCHSLINEVPVICEYDELDDPYMEFCIVRPSSGFAEECAHIARTASRIELGRRYAQLLSEKLPFPRIVQDLVRKSVLGDVS